MNFLQISLTTRCNYGCSYCPIAQWRNNTNELHPLRNTELIPWIEKNFIPAEWIIELTGGEPSIYNGIDELLNWLDSRDYKTIVKTNGTGNLKHYNNVRLIAAFHQLNKPPINYDEYLIIDTVDKEKKIEYCKKNNIPYKVIGFNQENPDNATHEFQYSAYLNPAGHQVGCQQIKTLENIGRDGIDKNEYFRKELSARDTCDTCKAAIDCWKFLPESWKH